jgi:hypothetical protein
VSGRIDRIDRNVRTQVVCVLDYKTTDKAKTPQETHFGPPRQQAEIPAQANGDLSREDIEYLAAADIPAELVGGKKAKRWADLQLPLYRELVRAQFGSNVQLGYVCLPNALGKTDFKLWGETYSDALHASAIRCSEAIAQRIRAGVFWPPGKATVGYLHDDLAGVLLGDPTAALCPPPRPPPTPWGAKP